jgi:hypothetical protein
MSKAKSQMTRIHLRNCLDGPVLIVPAKTGIIYENQTAGCCCNHPEMEGYLVPISVDELHKREIFMPGVWCQKGGIPVDPPDEWRNGQAKKYEDAVHDWWDKVCHDIEEISNGLIQVIQDVHQEEAWLWVRAKLDGELSSSGEWTKCVLTWLNSD